MGVFSAVDEKGCANDNGGALVFAPRCEPSHAGQNVVEELQYVSYICATERLCDSGFSVSIKR